MYGVVYDGCCNLCSTLVQALEQLDRGHLFCYVPMQAVETLAQWHITPTDCELGMILLNLENPDQRWQGSEAAEEIMRLLPTGQAVVQFYRNLPGLKPLGDRTYAQVRDHRYDWFGRLAQPYVSSYPLDICSSCSL